MRKIVAVTILLVVLVGIVGVAPVASQGPDEPFTATPLVPGSSITVAVEKDGAPAIGEPVLRGLAADESDLGLVAEELEVVSIIVTFDDSVDANDLEAVSGGQVIHRYNTIFNGASIILEGSKVDAVASMTGVTGVYLDELLQPDCDDDPTFDYTNPRFIGAPSVWPGSNAGEGVVVGVLDTGIWPEHPSFAADGTYPTPPGTYACDFGDTAFNPNDAPFTCNNKLIGAYDFLDTYKAYTGLIPYDPVTGLGEFDSARDSDGHGTHTSSTAAGNFGVEASMLGVDRGKVSGIAPRAHVIMYKVCGDAGCYSSDSAAAVEQAILDGVDVINFSISGGSSPYSDIVSLAFLDAYEAGVFVAASAGNSGPGADTVAHREPWAMTVGASTNDRHFLSTVTLTGDSDTLTLTGASVTNGIDTSTSVVFPPAGEELCLTPFAPGTFSGEIVICERGAIARVEKSFNVAEGGAGGMLLYNPVLQGLATDNHFIPSVHLENDDGVALLDFMATHTGVTATFTPGTSAEVPGDMMAAFSSRGGSGQTLGISKPDITAPGVQILAGHSPMPVTVVGGLPGELFQAIGGTSMSSPHIAGSAALIKALYPDWTPGQIKSALMTTAWDDVVKEDGETPADPFDYGSGRVDLDKAGNPGLTISATGQDFVDHETDLWNANYPSLYVPVMPGLITVQRTVHSELSRRSWWRLSVDSPDDVNVYVPRWIRVPGDGDKTFPIIVDARDVPLDEVRHATLYLKRGHKTVRFPITIVRRQPVVTLETICDPGTFAKGETTDCTITIENTSFDEATVRVDDLLPRQLRLVPGSVVGADEHWRRWISYEGTLTGAEPPDIAVSVAPWGNGYNSLAGMGAPPNVTHSDESCANFSVPPFVYAGETYSSIGMVSNGYAVVGGCTGNDDISYINQVFPDTAPPNNVLAPFWTDLNPSAGGNYYAYSVGGGGSSWLLLEWENAPNYGDGLPNTFQIWVGLNGYEDISFSYGPALSGGDGGWLTVGAENEFGNRGANYYADGVGTLPTPLSDDIVVSSVPGTPGETHTITFTAYGRRKGDWKNCAYMTGDTFFGTNIACFSGVVE